MKNTCVRAAKSADYLGIAGKIMGRSADKAKRSRRRGRPKRLCGPTFSRNPRPGASADTPSPVSSIFRLYWCTLLVILLLCLSCRMLGGTRLSLDKIELGTRTAPQILPPTPRVCGSNLARQRLRRVFRATRVHRHDQRLQTSPSRVALDGRHLALTISCERECSQFAPAVLRLRWR